MTQNDIDLFLLEETSSQATESRFGYDQATARTGFTTERERIKTREQERESILDARESRFSSADEPKQSGEEKEKTEKAKVDDDDENDDDDNAPMSLARARRLRRERVMKRKQEEARRWKEKQKEKKRKEMEKQRLLELQRKCEEKEQKRRERQERRERKMKEKEEKLLKKFEDVKDGRRASITVFSEAVTGLTALQKRKSESAKQIQRRRQIDNLKVCSVFFVCFNSPVSVYSSLCFSYCFSFI